MSTKHTQGQLTLDETQMGLWLQQIDDAGHSHTIARMPWSDAIYGADRLRADALRLAHCWNCHDDLLEACKIALKEFDEMGCEHFAEQDHPNCPLCACKLAISKATL